MTPLGTEVPSSSLLIERDRPLEIFDGSALLSVYRNAGGDPFLVKWMDREGDLDRWLIFRVTDLALTQFEFLKTTLRLLIQSARDGYVFVRDTRRGEIVRTAIMHVTEMPPKYVPGARSVHDQDLNPSFDDPLDEQAFFLDGTWEPEEFADLDRKYRQAYSFLGAFGNQATGDPEFIESALRHEEFRSGWNYKPAFDHLALSLPRDDRAHMVTVQYNSPGLLRFDVDGHIAQSLREAYAALTADPDRAKRFNAAHERVLALRRQYEEIRVEQRKVEERRLTSIEGVRDSGQLVSVPSAPRPAAPLDRQQRAERIQAIAMRESSRQIVDVPDALKPAVALLEEAARLPLEDLARAVRVVDFNALLALSGSIYVAGELLLTFVRRVQSLARFGRKGMAELAGIPEDVVDSDGLSLADDDFPGEDD